MTMATITDSEIKDLSLGDYILSFDDGSDRDGEAGTYDEAEYDAVERRALTALDARLPSGWNAYTQTDENGTFLVARHHATGREISSSRKFLEMLTKTLDDIANTPGGVDLTDPDYLRSLLVPECDCDGECDHAYPTSLVERMRPLVCDVLRFLGQDW
jgi:hypothetical protein